MKTNLAIRCWPIQIKYWKIQTKKKSDFNKKMSDFNKELDEKIKDLDDFKIWCIVLLLDIAFIWYIYKNDLIQDNSKHLILLQVLVIVNIMLFYLLKHLFRKFFQEFYWLNTFYCVQVDLLRLCLFSSLKCINKSTFVFKEGSYKIY